MRKPWLFIAICLLVFLFAGCGAETEATATVTPTETAVPPPVSMTVSPTSTPIPSPTAVLPPSPTVTPTLVPIRRVMEGMVVDAVARNAAEIELLLVRHFSGETWEFVTEGPIGVDAAHLLVHRDTNQGVEVVFVEKGGRHVAFEVNDLSNP